MKHWITSYSVKYKDGREVEVKVTNIEATNIVEALEVIKQNFTNPLRDDPNVECVIIWNIDIAENDDVFPEEGDPNDH